ncbi:hypothetical protein BDZ89DRAFT_1073635 [Hymenopellis radicata]|nr:hypothetical protein BDZ89DRAFT_1073635 [Hymenopellis radicata]
MLIIRESHLGTVVEAALAAVKREEVWDYRIVGGELRTYGFSIRYSVIRGDKDMTLDTLDDFKTMLSDAVTKQKARPEIVLHLAELENENDDHGDGDNNEEEGPTMTPHEVQVNQAIESLKTSTICNDNTCTNHGKHCYPDAETTDHVFLTHTHFTLWGEAYVAKHQGVTLRDAPSTPFFQMGRTEEHKEELLRRQRRSAAMASSASSTNGHVTVVLQDSRSRSRSRSRSLSRSHSDSHGYSRHHATLSSRRSRSPHYQQLRCSSRSPPPPPRRPLANANHQSFFSPIIDLRTFCNHYGISDELNQKLTLAKITGPHVLQYLTEDALESKAGLDYVEIAVLRDGMRRWQYCSYGVME